MTRTASFAAFIIVLGLGALHGRTSLLEAVAQTNDTHAYFDALVARPDHLASYSLRDPDQLALRKDGGYTNNNSKPQYVTYNPMHDLDPRRQDAAKLIVPDFTNNLPNQVRLPIPTHAPQSLFVVWDVWFGAEWAPQRSGLDTHKTWQFASPGIHTEVRTRYKMSNGPKDIAMTDVRQYSAGTSWGPNTEEARSFGGNNYGAALGPMVGDFMVKAETWTRYFAFFDAPDAAGWYRFSLWVADEGREPVRILDRLQIKPGEKSSGGWEQFWLEYNTSKTDVVPGRGELVSYVRNIVMLKGLGDPSGLLKRPNAGLPLPPSTLAPPSAPRNLRIIPKLQIP
jgi:hypothetical protein